MASYFNLTLDTTAPLNGSISFNNQITNTKNITANISADGAVQMKIWGDIVVNN
jgi:hypothetical protein